MGTEMIDLEKKLAVMSDKDIRELHPETVRALAKENERLRQELQIRDNDILSYDQVFESIVSGTHHLILVMSTTTFKAEFITSNIESALGVPKEKAMEDVRRIGSSFVKIELCNGKEEIYIHRINGVRRQYLTYVINLPYGRKDRVAVVLLCRSNAVKGDLEDMMIQQTQDVNRAAGYFLASMSHDFRVPINSISGFVMLLMKNAKNPSKVMEYSHRIGVSCQELLSTVDQILDMSRIEAGDMELKSEEFGLGIMLEELCTLFSSLAKARNQNFFFSAAGIEHDIVIGDKARLMEMLRGVLSNAVKFTAPGGRIELTVTGTVEEGDDKVSLIFEVRDTGEGMDQRQLELYFRGEIPENTDNMPGRGTGIWFTRKLIKKMGGTITAQSRKGEGTILWIRLRLGIVNSGATHFWAERGIRRMLIANSNLQEAARIRNLMVSAGVDAVSISSGYGTVKLIEQAGNVETGFDIVLLDEDLQDMEWREVVTSVRAMTWIRMPMIILMSAEQIREEARRGAGVGYILQKPFYVSALHRLVEEVFEKHSGYGYDDAPEGDNILEGLRFLAAEDNVLNAEVLKELLEVSGAKCEIARNGRAALAMFGNSRPGTYDVILLDLLMPVMDGYAAAQAIRALDREDAKTIPIIAMTANTMEDNVEKSYRAGMNAHLTKPLDIRVLSSHVRHLKGSDAPEAAK